MQGNSAWVSHRPAEKFSAIASSRILSASSTVVGREGACGGAQAQHPPLAPAGTLRISAPVIFGTHALVPALAEYRARHPDVRVEATLAGRVFDLAGEGFEAALCIDSSVLVARAPIA